ncbi:MAG TPA: antibiotic biosynthesis monooxygenase [Clostridia bacterium]|nr:antibiotic biosynthesis monooxygenase [Clostridia bacterium]
MSNDTRVVLHLRIRAAEGKRDELLQFLRSAIPFYEQPGGIHLRVIQCTDDSDAFIEIVEYESWDKYQEDHRRVEADPAMHEYLARWRALLAEPAKVEVYNDISGSVRPREAVATGR